MPGYYFFLKTQVRSRHLPPAFRAQFPGCQADSILAPPLFQGIFTLHTKSTLLAPFSTPIGRVYLLTNASLHDLMMLDYPDDSMALFSLMTDELACSNPLSANLLSPVNSTTQIILLFTALE